MYDESDQFDSVQTNNPILVFISRLIVYLSCLFFGAIVTMANYQKVSIWHYLRYPNSLFDDFVESLHQWTRKRRNSKSVDSEIESETDLDPKPSVIDSKYSREYQTLRILGRGGFGLVFEAERKGDKQQLAVKRIKVSQR